MKNTICEKLMWSAMTPAIFKYIAANCKNTDTFRVKKKSRKNFKDMLARTPDIGGFTKNPLRICLSGGIVWLAVYEAMDGAMSHEQFGEMVTATMQASKSASSMIWGVASVSSRTVTGLFLIWQMK